MICDAVLLVCCDTEDCKGHTYLEMHWYTGGYDLDDDDAEDMLVVEGWKVEDGKHYCIECKQGE